MTPAEPCQRGALQLGLVATLRAMLYVYATPDRGARCITFDEDAPPAQFELVASFDEQGASEPGPCSTNSATSPAPSRRGYVVAAMSAPWLRGANQRTQAAPAWDQPSPLDTTE
jgi:hypothetical protein